MLVFDTLEYTKELTAVGVPQEQAEVQAKKLKEIIDNDLATKQDIAELRTELGRDLKELEMRITIRLGTMMVIAVGVVATLVKIL